MLKDGLQVWPQGTFEPEIIASHSFCIAKSCHLGPISMTKLEVLDRQKNRLQESLTLRAAIY